LKSHENRSAGVNNHADFNGDKIKTDKKPEVREKQVFHTFPNQNTIKTSRESKLSTLIPMVIKLSPAKNRKSEKNRFSILFKIKAPSKPACEVSWLC